MRAATACQKGLRAVFRVQRYGKARFLPNERRKISNSEPHSASQRPQAKPKNEEKAPRACLFRF